MPWVEMKTGERKIQIGICRKCLLRKECILLGLALGLLMQVGAQELTDAEGNIIGGEGSNLPIPKQDKIPIVGYIIPDCYLYVPQYHLASSLVEPLIKEIFGVRVGEDLTDASKVRRVSGGEMLEQRTRKFKSPFDVFKGISIYYTARGMTAYRVVLESKEYRDADLRKWRIDLNRYLKPLRRNSEIG